MARPRTRRLTDREREALSLVMAGKSNKEIAGELGETEVCVKTRIRAAMRKLGIRNSRQLIPRADEIRQMFHMTPS
jgi:DNA-binding NarL/FixJ family response regulator